MTDKHYRCVTLSSEVSVKIIRNHPVSSTANEIIPVQMMRRQHHFPWQHTNIISENRHCSFFIDVKKWHESCDSQVYVSTPSHLCVSAAFREHSSAQTRQECSFTCTRTFPPELWPHTTLIGGDSKEWAELWTQHTFFSTLRLLKCKLMKPSNHCWWRHEAHHKSTPHHCWWTQNINVSFQNR